MLDCTTLDHIYPGGCLPGTPCHCGRRTWAAARRIPVSRARVLRAGMTVRVLGTERTIVEKLRGEDVYRMDAPVSGRALFERDEIS